jgi:hypothetical protein
MLYLQQGPAETTVYMVAGYSVIFGFMLLYLISLAVRGHRMAQDLTAMEEMENSHDQSNPQR